MPATKPTRRWHIFALALILWLVVTATCSYLFIRFSYESFNRDLLRAYCSDLGGLLEHAASDSWPPERIIYEANRYDAVAYAMVWSEDGRVLLHTSDRLVGTYLDVNKWSTLEHGERERFRTFKTEVVQHGRNFFLDHPQLSPVLELTVPIEMTAGASDTSPATHARSQRIFLSIALNRDDLFEQHVRTISYQGLLALTFTSAGALLLLLTLHLTFRHFDKSRREIEQTARARTSLLTERGMLASVLAHEVRSPLTALRFNLHALRSLVEASAPATSEGGGDKRLELTDRCEREIRRLDGMLTDFLQRTQVVTPAEPAAVNTIISEAIEFLTPALERNHIRISLHLDPSNPRVHVHPDELRQVILNLSANAMEAMPAPKGGTLAISTLAPPAEGEAPKNPLPGTEDLPPAATPVPGMITLLFRDSGIGIPPDRLERIFEPFFSTKPNGSGLGLTLVRRVISGAGGTVFVESKPAEGGGGTTFRILLPASTQ